MLKIPSRVLLLALLLQFSTRTCFSQMLGSEELFSKVVLLRSGNNSGSGFILKADSNYFLVTAKHVADSLNPNITDISFKDSLNKAHSFLLKEFTNGNLINAFNNNSDFFIMLLFGELKLPGNLWAVSQRPDGGTHER